MTVRADARDQDGWPVPNAVLTVTDMMGNQVTRVQADEDGVLVTDALPAGSYTAILTAAGYQPQAVTAMVTWSGQAMLGVVTMARDGGLPLPEPGSWAIDPVHSSIMVTARHLGLSSVKGRFTEFSGRVEVYEPAEQSTVHAVIQATSIDTGSAMRDDHLRSADFLEVERFPVITFTGDGEMTRVGADRWELPGVLGLHGVSREVVLALTYLGTGPDPWGGTRAAFRAVTQLQRADFAIDYSAVVRAGVAAVGTKLSVELDIQAVRDETAADLP